MSSWTFPWPTPVKELLTKQLLEECTGLGWSQCEPLHVDSALRLSKREEERTLQEYSRKCHGRGLLKPRGHWAGQSVPLNDVPGITWDRPQEQTGGHPRGLGCDR